jgi:hypothetical protein
LGFLIVESSATMPPEKFRKIRILLQKVSPEGLPETADKYQILCTIKLDKKRNFLQTL